MKPSTSLGTRSNVGIAKPSPAVRQTGNMRCLLVMGGVYRSSVLSGGTQVKYRCRCRVKLNLEPQTIIVHERCVRQGQVTAEQDDMGAGLGAQVALHDDDDIQRLRERLMEQGHLIDTGLYLSLDCGLFEI